MKIEKVLEVLNKALEEKDSTISFLEWDVKSLREKVSNLEKELEKAKAPTTTAIVNERKENNIPTNSIGEGGVKVNG